MRSRWIGLPLLLAVAVGQGCSRWKAPALPVASSVVLDQLVVYSDFDLPQDHRLLSELNDLRAYVRHQLELPESSEPIHVYLFKTPRRYQAFIRKHYPQYPERRALFVETDTQLKVYAYWGERIAEDLRHEVVHGYLHAVVPNLPLWLDEGLAEYFEVDRTGNGRNGEHLELLLTADREGAWRPDITRLESLRKMNDMQQMDYAESWAWVYFLMHSRSQNRRLLADYLKELGGRRTAGPLSVRLRNENPEAEAQLLEFLRGLDRPK